MKHCISIDKRISLEYACYLFFGDEKLAGCIEGVYTPTSWFWQKNFRIKEHGVLLSYLLFNGVLQKEDELKVFDFFVKYKGRIVGTDIKIRKCVIKKIKRCGFESGICAVMLASFTNGQLFLSQKPECCRLIEEILPTVHVGRNNAVKCAYITHLLNTYTQLEQKTSIMIQEKNVHNVLKLVISGGIFDTVFTFTDKIVATALLKVCTSRKKIRSTSEKVRTILTTSLNKSLLPDILKQNILNKYDEGVKILLKNYHTFTEQSSQEDCLKAITGVK